MSYKLKKKTTPNKDSRTVKPSEIVLHHWGAKGQKIANVVSWLCNPSSGVSAHYVVQDGKVYQLADPAKWTTWHAGNWSHNCKSIGIEARPEMTKGDRETVAELVADLWERFGIIPIKEHRQIVSTACPGNWSAKKVEAEAKKIYNERKTGINGVVFPARGYFDVGDKGNSVKLVQRFLNERGADLETDGIYGTKTKKAVKKWQKSVGLKADGLFGPDSLKAARKQNK